MAVSVGAPDSPTHPEPMVSAGCKNPVFVCGSPRSGTTAVWRALKQHPNLGPAPGKWQEKELWFFAEFFAGRDAENTNRRTHFTDGVFCREAIGFINAFMTRQCASPTGRYLTGYIDNLQYTRTLLKHLPEARFIFVARHPQETVWSLLNVFFATGFVRDSCGEENITEQEIIRATDIWKRATSVVLEAVRGGFGSSVLVVRHEEMVRDPEAVARQMLEFVGEPEHPAVADSMAKGIINSSFAPDRAQTEKSFSHVVSVGEAGARQQYFDNIRSRIAARNDLCDVVLARTAAEMRALGYQDYRTQYAPAAKPVESAAPEPAATTTSRAGEIVEVSLLNEQGEPKDKLKPGDKVAIKIVVRAHTKVANASVSFVVADARQKKNLFGTLTFDEKVKLPELQAGEELEVRFAFLQVLRQGSYNITVSFNSVSKQGYTDNVLHHQLNGVCAFTVDYAAVRPVHHLFFHPVGIEFRKHTPQTPSTTGTNS